MKKKNLLFCLLLFSASFFYSPSGWAQGQKWTYLVYLLGSDLESDGNNGTMDLGEMMQVGSTPNLNVIVTTGGANKDNSNTPGGINWKKIQRWKIEKGRMTNLNYTAADNNMASPANLSDFITWGVQNFPADKYVLVMWDHGGAIDGYGDDEVSGKKFSVMQVQEGLEKAFQKTQQKFEVFGFDACLMANIEAMMNYRKYANYFVASEDLEPGHGWNYTPIFKAISGNSVTDGASLGKVIANGFLEQGKSQGTTGVTLSVINNAKTDNVISALDRFIADLSVAVRKSGSIKYIPVSKARSQAEEYGKSDKSPEESSDVVDLIDFAKHVKKSDPSTAASADALIRAINEAVVYKVRDHTRPNANGLTIFLPFNKLASKKDMPEVLSKYNSIPFSQAWQRFVKEYTAAAVGDAVKPEIPEGVHDQDNVVEALCTSEDLDEAYVVLIAPDAKDDNVIRFLGVMMPDEVDETDKGYSLKYNWDGKWIALNGEPANISEMYVEEYEDDEGNVGHLTIIEVPALLNDEYVTLEFTVDEDGSYDLTNITPEIDESGLFPKETYTIEPGDKLTFIYDTYNIETDEEIEEEGQTITINSKDDIELSVINLPKGEYLIGYLLIDYNQNEEFFLYDKVFTIK